MKRKLVLTGIIAFSFLISLIAGMHAIDFAKANPITYRSPIITVISPTSIETYSKCDVPLIVAVEIFGYTYHSIETLDWLNYSIDGKAFTPMTLTPMPGTYAPDYLRVGSAVITDLPAGVHEVKIQGQTTIGAINQNIQANVTFTIKNKPTLAPTLSPVNSPSDSPLEQPIAEPFPTTIVLASSVITVVSCLCLFVYFKKRKH